MSLVEVIEKLSDTSFRPLRKVNEEVIQVDATTSKSYIPATKDRPTLIELRIEGDEVYIDFDKDVNSKSMPLTEGFHIYLLKPNTTIYFKAVNTSATVYIYEWVTL